MFEAKNTARALVRIGFDGRVHKTFRAKNAQERFDNEVRVLQYLEKKGCDFVPRLLEVDAENLRISTTNCGARVEQMSDEKLKSLFEELESYGVRHEDPYLRNITYRNSDGRFCIIDFEFASIIGADADDPQAVGTADEDDAVGNASDSSAAAAAPTHANTKRLIRWSAVTDQGRFRPNNEDTYLAIAFDMRDFYYLGKMGEVHAGQLDFVFAVSDGMGGEKSGEFASKFTTDNITRLLPRRFQMSPAHYRSGITECLNDLFQSIHRQLTNLGQSYHQGHNMGATLSLVWYVDGHVYFGHIGDSRIYLLPREGRIRQITADHTHVGWLRRQGKLNEREARSHPRKNVLAQALGAGNLYLKPQLGEIRCQTGDRILLCTDGVIEGLWDHAIEEILRDPRSRTATRTPAETLVKLATAESGRDNASALFIEMEE
jgi:serine/threonine protein phosphatase PrpC